ncbi:MAG: hypothetical protein GY841_13895, partial [FCB group bacterium]|nr:hypothetical protein [FCB group bacterium]
LGDAPDGSLSAPSGYPTLLADNGARHRLLPAGPKLGTLVDGELDGQPTIGATGDDLAGVDDEDGVTFTSTLNQGQSATVDVTTTGGGLLSAWIDFNGDGDWEDPGEKIFDDLTLADGSNTALSFDVPTSATAGLDTYARFRLSSVSELSFDGPATDGEVEDYQVTIRGLDLGDAPDGSLSAPSGYPTLLADNGARHRLLPAGPKLGTLVDGELDGQP